MKLGISHQRPTGLTDDHLSYLRSMGVETMEVRVNSAQASLEFLADIEKRVKRAGFELHEIMLEDLYSSDQITLGLPGRDAAIETFKSFLEDLGRLGIQYTTYAWRTGGAYETGRSTTRGVQTRLFESKEAQRLPNAYDRVWSDEEMWENYAYFLEQVLPTARANGVKLQLHPNDPPLAHEGIARIFSSTEAFRRAIELSNGDVHAGILFCVGTWSEMPGPEGTGENIPAAIREFGASGHIHQVHFRNTSGPLPGFQETFPDNGYIDLVGVMRALADVGFDGIVVPDHVPGGGRVTEAYTFGYIRALIQAFA